MSEAWYQMIVVFPLSISSAARGRGFETYRGPLSRAGHTQLADMLSKFKTRLGNEVNVSQF